MATIWFSNTLCIASIAVYTQAFRQYKIVPPRLFESRRARHTISASASSPRPFGALLVTQDALRRDIKRRYDELTLLGWLGRAYLAAPFVFGKVFPRVFFLTTYDATAAACYERPGVLDLTLKEGSVGGVKGIPFRLQFETNVLNRSDIIGVSLVSIGCDLKPFNAPLASKENGAIQMSEDRLREVCEMINTHAPIKVMIVKAIAHAIFGELSKVAQAIEEGIDLEMIGGEVIFSPRKELWALEGTSYKWLQQVSGYYFAESRLQDVRFASVAESVRFTFYLDPAEPLNSVNPTQIVNPEVINCVFEV